MTPPRLAPLACLSLALAACGGSPGAAPAPGGTAPVATVAAPASVTAGQAGYSASVPSQPGAAYAWTIENGTIVVGATASSVAFTPGASGTVTLRCTVTLGGASASGSASAAIAAARPPPFNLAQAISDGAQSTTLAFSGFGMMTGNLGAQSFFPPGKVADYWGFQYLRDNDPDGMGHNTSFLTRVACNVLFILDDAQLAELKALAAAQVADINLYAWKRYPLMKAFRRLLDGSGPAGSPGLDPAAVKAASRDLYVLDGRISFDRARVYARIFRTLTAEQKAWLGRMAGRGFGSWPDKSEVDVRARTAGLPHDEVVAVMTYAGDLYSWYAGSVASDVYFCPERHGTYFGSFYVKDAPAVGHPGYSIDEQLTATVGRALVDPQQGYISAEGAARMGALASLQRSNLYAGGTNIVLARTRISEALRRLIADAEPDAAALEALRAEVDAWSGAYGELDGENNHQYATTFAALWRNAGGSYLTPQNRADLAALRQRYMTVTYGDGSTVDFSVTDKHFLYAAEVPSGSPDLLAWTSDTASDRLFLSP